MVLIFLHKDGVQLNRDTQRIKYAIEEPKVQPVAASVLPDMHSQLSLALRAGICDSTANIFISCNHKSSYCH